MTTIWNRLWKTTTKKTTKSKILGTRKLFCARITLPASLTEDEISAVSTALDDIACASTALRKDKRQKGGWVLEWILEDKPDPQDLTARLCIQSSLKTIKDLDVTADKWIIGEVPDKNWLEESYKQLRPFSVGPLFIYGSHFDGDVPRGQMGLQIDAATAFGSGEHGTTKGCLQAMFDLKEEGLCPWNVLDMGTGSGILAIAAWKLWKTPILAVDIDEEAVKVANRHREANDVKESNTALTCIQGNGFQAGAVQERKPFDLIIANILSGPLKDMANDLKSVLDDNGYVILSGLLNEQAEDVLKTYEDLGLKLKKRYDLDEWSTLVLLD